MKVVLVSGGSKGLGAALVQAFLEDGYKVATFSRSVTPAVQQWRESFADLFYFDELDITERPACRDYLSAKSSTLGSVDILVNNAGAAHTSLLPLTDEDAIDRVVDLNLKSTLYLTHLVSRPMLSLGWGRIINISSIVGLSGYRGLSVYSATKAALDGFSRSLARELGARNITVNSVAPGYLDTEMTDELDAKQQKQIIGRTPVGRLGTPQDIAGLVSFLASDKAGFITGQTIVADGGINC